LVFIYQEIVQRNIDLAQKLTIYIEKSEIFQLVAPTRVNVVCFKLVDLSPEKQQLFLKTVNESGKLFITASVYREVSCFRAAFVNWQTTEKDISIAIAALEETYETIKNVN